VNCKELMRAVSGSHYVYFDEENNMFFAWDGDVTVDIYEWRNGGAVQIDKVVLEFRPLDIDDLGKVIARNRY
jgi:hypothetical protein